MECLSLPIISYSDLFGQLGSWLKPIQVTKANIGTVVCNDVPCWASQVRLRDGSSLLVVEQLAQAEYGVVARRTDGQADR